MPATTLWRLDVNGETVELVRQFSYSSDILAVGEECRWSIVNPGRKYVGQLKTGSVAEIYAINADVNGGQPTKKFKGRIVQREANLGPDGATIELGIFDLGWHLTNCCAPLWFRLDRANFVDLLDPERYVVGKNGKKAYFIEPEFGFTGVRTDGLARRRTKLGASAVSQLTRQELQPVFYVQIEPGEKFLDKLMEYARRENRLINVSPTGEIQAFLPDYDQPPQFEFLQLSSDSQDNNILQAKEVDNCSTRYTRVEVVGQQLAGEVVETSPTEPNATKKRGCVTSSVLPFPNRLTVADGDMYSRGLAQKLADWYFKRGLYDAYYIQIKVSGHHQNGVWYESDMMASVIIEDLGIKGLFYISAVQYTVDEKQGDVALITLRVPYLLTASFGAFPQPVIKSASPSPGTPKQEQPTS